MKICTLKNLGKIACVGFIAGYGYCLYDIVKDTKNYKSVDDLKNEIKMKDPNRYKTIMQKPIFSRPMTYENWAYEVQIMDDSIKTAGLIEKARFEGEQKIRDSIANTKEK